MPNPRFTHNRLTWRLEFLMRQHLWAQVMAGLILGIGAGLCLGPDLNWVDRETATILGGWLALPGNLFLSLIRMVIVPLVAASIIFGIAGSGGGTALKMVGQRMAAFVLLTTVAATVIGTAITKTLRPGKDMPIQSVPVPVLKPEITGMVPDEPSRFVEMTRDLPNMIVNLIPENIVASILAQDMLAIVIFSLVIGLAVVSANKSELTRPLITLAEAVLEVCMTVIKTAMRMVPVAVFGLMADTTATNGIGVLSELALYCGGVIMGLALLFLLYLVIVVLFGNMRWRSFLQAILPVQLLAFSTSSSAAVMPLTMKTAVEKLGTPAPLAGAIVPLASTVNMAGTALYQSAAIVFLADIAGVDLSWGNLALIMITLTGASIGAPAAPGASIAILSSTAAAFGIPLTGLPLIMGVDRILDMARTSVNVAGDLVLCRVLSPREAVGPAPEAHSVELS